MITKTKPWWRGGGVLGLLITFLLAAGSFAFSIFDKKEKLGEFLTAIGLSQLHIWFSSSWNLFLLLDTSWKIIVVILIFELVLAIWLSVEKRNLIWILKELIKNSPSDKFNLGADCPSPLNIRLLDQRAEKESLEEVVKKGKKLVVIGSPGCGQTYACNWLIETFKAPPFLSMWLRALRGSSMTVVVPLNDKAVTAGSSTRLIEELETLHNGWPRLQMCTVFDLPKLSEDVKRFCDATPFPFIVFVSNNGEGNSFGKEHTAEIVPYDDQQRETILEMGLRVNGKNAPSGKFLLEILCAWAIPEYLKALPGFLNTFAKKVSQLESPETLTPRGAPLYRHEVLDDYFFEKFEDFHNTPKVIANLSSFAFKVWKQGVVAFESNDENLANIDPYIVKELFTIAPSGNGNDKIAFKDNIIWDWLISRHLPGCRIDEIAFIDISFTSLALFAERVIKELRGKSEDVGRPSKPIPIEIEMMISWIWNQNYLVAAFAFSEYLESETYYQEKLDEIIDPWHRGWLKIALRKPFSSESNCISESRLLAKDTTLKRQCNFSSVNISGRFHWDDEISLSS
jgi:hypothetical protein